MHIGGAKNGTPATHPLSGREMRELRRHQRESAPSPFVFVSKRGAPLSAPGFSRMIERAANSADLGIKATCCAMLAATSSPTMATTRARSKPISGIATFRARRATPPWRRIGLRNFFAIESAWIADRERAAAPFLPQKHRAECQTLLVEPETAADSFFLQPTGSTHRRSQLVHCGGIRFELI
jgi:hypothetical protein